MIKKIILLTLFQLTILMAGSFVMKQGNPLIKTDTSIPIIGSDEITYDREVTVNSIEQLENAVKSADISTRIIVQNGTYNSTISLDGNTAPVAIQSAIDFGAHFQSAVYVKGDNITIQKCSFSASGYAYIYGSDIKLLRNVWDNSAATDWIKLTATAYRTEIGYNLFKNRSANVKTGSQLIEQRVNDNTTKAYATHVHHNYFKDILKSSMYSEVYLIYTNDGINPAQSIDNNIIIEYNLFENAPGDGRMIDIKTNGVTVKYNTVTRLSSTSAFKNRSANRCTFEYNVFTSGYGKISAQGENNIIRGNYIEHSPDSTESAFRFYYGSDTITGAQYNQMKNTLIEDNILINSNYGFEFGRNHSAHTKPLENTIIRGNKIINGGTRSTTRGDLNFSGVTWENNEYSGNGGKFAENMTNNESLEVTVPVWKLTPQDVGVEIGQ